MNRVRKLYTKGFDGKTLEEFAVFFFNHGNTVPTYFKNGKLHCPGNCNRSFHDYYAAAVVYFPEVTIKEAYESIINAPRKKHPNYPALYIIPTLSVCHDINKPVVMYGWAGIKTHQEYMMNQKLNTKYSWNDIKNSKENAKY